MPDADYLRLQAQHCRELAAAAVMLEAQEQLAIFAEDFEADATALDRVVVVVAPGTRC